MRSKGRHKGKDKVSKTDLIARVFTERPLDQISPKEISTELDLDIQLVTSIVSRLRSEGLIERVGWGKYKLRMDHSIEDGILNEINRDMRKMTAVILGAPGKMEEEEEGGFKSLLMTYERIKEIGGDSMALNLLRLSARKHLDEKDTKLLLGSVMEVMGGDL